MSKPLSNIPEVEYAWPMAEEYKFIKKTTYEDEVETTTYDYVVTLTYELQDANRQPLSVFGIKSVGHQLTGLASPLTRAELNAQIEAWVAQDKFELSGYQTVV